MFWYVHSVLPVKNSLPLICLRVAGIDRKDFVIISRRASLPAKSEPYTYVHPASLCVRYRIKPTPLSISISNSEDCLSPSARRVTFKPSAIVNSRCWGLICLSPGGQILILKFGWGAPAQAIVQRTGRHLRAPVASHCGEPSPIKNKFNIVVGTWPTYQILNW